jgi:hypothetical protein
MKQAKQSLAAKPLYSVFALGTIIVSFITALACNSNSSSKLAIAEQGSTKVKNNVALSQADPDPGINLNCIYDHLQNPPESFHYLYKKDGSSPVHQEADITPQSIDGFRVRPDGSPQPLHGTRSDPQSWQGAIAGLTAISGMSSTVAIINHNSAMRREPDGGQLNGYGTIHYSIDTARFNATERQMLLNPTDSEKGDAWVSPEGCPVKLTLDSELHRKDGSFIDKIRYEEAMVKKP